jgi:hypothetical protein
VWCHVTEHFSPVAFLAELISYFTVQKWPGLFLKKPLPGEWSHHGWVSDSGSVLIHRDTCRDGVLPLSHLVELVSV